MKKQSQIVLLPTDQPSTIYLQKDRLYEEKYPVKSINAGNQFLYILSADFPKEGEWGYYKNGSVEGLHKFINGSRPKALIFQKIIATSNPELLIEKSGILKISSEYISSYILEYNRGNKIEFVTIGYEWVSDFSGDVPSKDDCIVPKVINGNIDIIPKEIFPITEKDFYKLLYKQGCHQHTGDIAKKCFELAQDMVNQAKETTYPKPAFE